MLSGSIDARIFLVMGVTDMRSYSEFRIMPSDALSTCAWPVRVAGSCGFGTPWSYHSCPRESDHGASQPGLRYSGSDSIPPQNDQRP